jgi:Na+/H+ antiporter NhaD/arsenite permease-like protein
MDSNPVLLPLVIFAVTFFFIFTERVNRTLAALIGGLAMVVSGAISQSEALAAVQFPAIGAIIGILILVSVVRSSGLFSYLAIKAVKSVKGNPAHLMIVLSLMSAMMASFLGGTATILIMGNLIVLVCKQLNLKMPPYLMAAALMSSVGGGFFLTGGSINILISGAAGFSFVDFFTNTLPVALLLGIVTSVFFVWYFKLENKPVPGEILLDENQAIRDRGKFYIASGLLLLTVVLFVFAGSLGLTIEIIAISTGILGLLLTNLDPEKAFREVQWDTLFFLIGIFVLMGGIEKSGLFHFVARLISPIMQSGLGLVFLVWTMGPLSGIVHALPITVALIPIVTEVSRLGGIAAAPMFWTLLLAINFGENLTPIGSSSSILAMGIGRESGQPVGFKEFLKVSVILTLAHLAIITGWILVRYH